MLYGAMKVTIGGPLKVAFRPWVEGLVNIPAEGPAILASNHLSFSDSFFLPAVLDRKVTFIAKAEYFTTPGVKGRLTAAFFKGVGQLPVDRSGGAGRARRPSRAAPTSLSAVSCSASIPRARARPTGGSTGASRAASRAWRSPAGPRSSRSP